MIFLLNILIILSLFKFLFYITLLIFCFKNFKIFILTCYKIILNNLYTNVGVDLKITIL